MGIKNQLSAAQMRKALRSISFLRQISERATGLFGAGYLEMLAREITAVSLYQATLPVPGRVIPRDPEIETAVWQGETVFDKIGCASCHIPALPLSQRGWTFEEPGPFNPATNAHPGDLPAVRVNLNDSTLPLPRLRPAKDRPHLVYVPAYTDFKLHDITDPTDPSAAEPLDQNETIWSPKFRKGNRMFLTKRLWGCANEPPYFHHGQFTTLRQATLFTGRRSPRRRGQAARGALDARPASIPASVTV